MTDHDALLRAILAAPHEDTPRLVYADWLQEHSHDARAEFIRVQVEMAKTPTCDRRQARRPCYQDGQCRWCFLAIQRTQLMWLTPDGGPALWKQWCDGVDPSWVLLDTDNDQWTFGMHRGFLDAVTLAAADWLAHGDAIRARHPVKSVRLTTWPGETVGWNREPSFLRPDGNVEYEGWPGVTFQLPAA